MTLTYALQAMQAQNAKPILCTEATLLDQLLDEEINEAGSVQQIERLSAIRKRVRELHLKP